MKKNYYDIVKGILSEYPKTRDDDLLLWGVFLHKYQYVGRNENFYDVIQTAQKRKIPSYESITRVRRKVQECEPLLRGTRRAVRKQEEKEYHDFYRHKTVKENMLAGLE